MCGRYQSPNNCQSAPFITGLEAGYFIYDGACRVGPGYFYDDTLVQVGAFANNPNGISTCPPGFFCPGNYVLSFTAPFMDFSQYSTYIFNGASASTVNLNFYYGIFMCPIGFFCPDSTAIPKPCPTGSSGGTTPGAPAIAIDSCTANPGYYVDASNPNNNGVLSCPANSYCLGGTSVGSTVSDTTKHSCPAHSGNTASASNTGINTCLVGPGYYVDPGSLLSASLCPADQYCPGNGNNPAFTVAIGATGGNFWCPSGTTLATAIDATAATNNNDITDCVLGAGLYLAASNTNQPEFCDANSYCPGGGHVGTAGGINACPPGTGVGAIQFWTDIPARLNTIADCVVRRGFYVDPSNPNLPTWCTANRYCPGGGPTGVDSTTLNPPGILSCPTGSSLGAATSDADAYDNHWEISNCVVNAGFYIDQSLNTPFICLVDDYCPGNGNVGTAGGLFPCPTGSNTAGSYGNDAVEDCLLDPGQFTDWSAGLYTPQLCPADYYCPGGTRLGSFVYNMNQLSCPNAWCAAGITNCPFGSGVSAPVNAAAATTGNNDITDCIVWPGFYLSGPEEPQLCEANFYCPGGQNLYGSAGIFPCPGNSGISYPFDSYDAASRNNQLSDCIVEPGYYIDMNTGPNFVDVWRCEPGFFCPGGGRVTNQGGSFECPLGSSSHWGASAITQCYLTPGFYVPADTTLFQELQYGAYPGYTATLTKISPGSTQWDAVDYVVNYNNGQWTFTFDPNFNTPFPCPPRHYCPGFKSAVGSDNSFFLGTPGGIFPCPGSNEPGYVYSSDYFQTSEATDCDVTHATILAALLRRTDQLTALAMDTFSETLFSVKDFTMYQNWAWGDAWHGLSDTGEYVTLVSTRTWAVEPNPNVRLVGGSTPFEGTLELFLNNQWNTVCDDFWESYNNAEVACRMLGLSTSNAQYLGSAYFGQGQGRVAMDNVMCQGYEASLLGCYHQPLYHNDCSHWEDVGVRCSGPGEAYTGTLWIPILSSEGAGDGWTQNDDALDYLAPGSTGFSCVDQEGIFVRFPLKVTPALTNDNFFSMGGNFTVSIINPDTFSSLQLTATINPNGLNGFVATVSPIVGGEPTSVFEQLVDTTQHGNALPVLFMEKFATGETTKHYVSIDSSNLLTWSIGGPEITYRIPLTGVFDLPTRFTVTLSAISTGDHDMVVTVLVPIEMGCLRPTLEDLARELRNVNATLNTTILNAQWELDARLDNVNATLNTTLLTEQWELEARLNNVNSKLNTTLLNAQWELDARLNNVNATLNTTILNAQAELDARLGNVTSAAVNAVLVAQDELDARMNNVNAMLNTTILDAQAELDALMNNVNATLDTTILDAQAELDARMNNVNATLNTTILDAQAELDARIQANLTVVDQNLNLIRQELGLLDPTTVDTFSNAVQQYASATTPLEALNMTLDDFQAEVDARISNANATLNTTLLNAQWELDARLNNVNSTLNTTLLTAQAELDARMNNVNSTLNTLADALESDLDYVNLELKSRLNNVNSTLSARIDSTLANLNATMYSVLASITKSLAATAATLTVVVENTTVQRQCPTGLAGPTCNLVAAFSPPPPLPPGSVSAPAPPSTARTVTASSTLAGLTSSTFNGGAVTSFKNATAAAVGVPSGDSVQVTSVVDVTGRRRRLQQTAVKVGFSVAAPSTAAAAYVLGQLTSPNFGSSVSTTLQNANVPVTGIEVDHSSVVMSTAPMPPPPAKDNTGLYGLFALFALIPIVLLTALLVKCVWRRKVEELEQHFSAKLEDMEQQSSASPAAAQKILMLSAPDVPAAHEDAATAAVNKTRKSTVLGLVTAPVDSPFLTSV